MQKLRDSWQQHRILETINRPHLKKSHLGWVIVGVLTAGMSFNATVVQAAPNQSTNIVETDKTMVAEAENIDSNSVDIKTDLVEKTTEKTATEKTVSTADVDKATATKIEVQATAYQLQSVGTAAAVNLASGTFGTSAWTISADGTLHIGSGEFAALTHSGAPWSQYADKIKKIVFDGAIVANADSHNLFGGLNQVTSIEGLNKLDTHQVTNMEFMFYGMSSLTSLDLSSFNTSQVESMSHMFDGMSSLTSLDLSNFDTSQVTNMQYMFSKMSTLTSLDVSKFDTSKVRYMNNMFYRMSSLTSLDLSNFDTSKVTRMSNMFYGMSKLNRIKFGANFDTSAARSAVLPNVAGIKQWRQVGSGTVDNPTGKFRNSATINTTEPVVSGTYVLDTYTVVDFWKPNAANTYGVTGLENYISSTDPFGNGNVKYVHNLIAADQTEVLAKGIFGTAKWYISMDGVLHIGAGEFAATNYSSPWSQYADEIKKIVFDGAVVANADSSSLFGYLNQVTSIEGLNKLDTHQVTSMVYMFYGMSSLTSLDLSNFNTSQVTNMSYMFNKMSSLTSLDLSNFDTRQVTDMSFMFYEMSSLTSLDLSKFDTSRVTRISHMFYGMSKLNQITFGANFDTSAVTSVAAVLPNVADSKQWRQVGSGTVNNPTGAFRNSATINTTEPVVADTYVLDTYTVVDFWKPNADANTSNNIGTYGMAGLENYISSTDPFGNGNVMYVHELTAANQTEVLAKGIFGTAKWYISMDGVLHIGAGEFAAPTSDSLPSSPWSQYADKIKKIVFDGVVVANAYSTGLFKDLSHVTSIEGLNKLDTHQVTNMDYMFGKMSSLASLDLSNFDTSQVTRMNSMFQSMSSLTSLNVSNFDTSQVTNMYYMFAGMSNLTSFDLSNFNTSQVTNMSYMFSSMSRLTSLDVSDFDTSQVTDTGGMFSRMSSLTSLDVSNFDTSQVTNMSSMFKDMSRLTSLDVSNFKTIKVTNMYYMFSGMSSLTSLDLSNFNTSQVKYMYDMFSGVSNLTSLDLSNFDTSKVTKMSSMFEGMSKLKQIRFGANFDTSAAGSFLPSLPNADSKQWRQVGAGTVDKPTGAFRNSEIINTTEPVVADTYVLDTHIVADFWKPNAANTYGVAGLENYISSTDPFGNGNVKYVNDLTAADQTEVLAKGIFGTAKWYISMDGVLHIGAGEFAATNGGESFYDDSPWYKYADKIKKIVFDGDVVANANSHSLFENLNQATSIESLNKLDTHQVTNMEDMFRGMRNLTSLDVSNFDTSQVVYMTAMFVGMSSLTSLDVSNFDTSRVTNMESMFNGMSSLTSLDVSNFDTSQVTDMGSMFVGMSSLTSLDLSNFNTSQVTNMYAMFSMFYEMSSLTSLDVSNFNTSQVTNMSLMFCGMNSLTSLDLSNFDTSHVTNMNNMFSDMSSLTNLDVSNFNTRQVIDMHEMFDNVSSLTSLDLSNFDTSKVTNMNNMFNGMSKLNQITFGANFDTSAVTSARFADLPNVYGIKQWRQVGSGTVDKPTGAFRISEIINTTEPVVADTYVLTDKTQQYVITVKDDTGDLMPNVKLGFYDQNGKLVATVETDANGVASVSLPIYDYTVKQVSDVKNHDAADNLNVLQDNPTGTMTLSWQTTSSNMLPVTGSQGMLAMMTAGVVLLFGLLGFNFKKNKKDLQ